MEPLAKLFGNPTRLKLLRLFLFNDDITFTADDAAFRTRASKSIVRKELSLLATVGIIRKKTGKGSGRLAYAANKKFSHFFALQSFLRDSTEVSDTKMLSTLRRAGSLRLVILSGMFTGAVETKVDLIVVGDKLEERPLATAVHTLEADLGRELRYAYFTTEEFKYRVGVYDRLVRDVVDYPHRTILDRIGLE